MKIKTKEILNNMIIRYPELSFCEDSIYYAISVIIDCYNNKGKLLICGNGGSASDAQHIVGELMKGFVLPRKISQEKQNTIIELFPENADYLIENLQGTLNAISLVGETALSTAYANDKAPDLAFAQQVLGYGNKEDILIAISTSGNSKNVIYAAQIAKVNGMKVISLTGSSGGILKSLSDVTINVPSDETYIIQEYHLPVYHALCLALENEFFGGEE
jgi:D-sedoheptulose 7-phosphate isomerase